MSACHPLVARVEVLRAALEFSHLLIGRCSQPWGAMHAPGRAGGDCTRNTPHGQT